MYFDKQLKLMTRAHKQSPVISRYGIGLDECAIYRWCTTVVTIQVPTLPLPMLAITIGGNKKISYLNKNKSVPEAFSLTGNMMILPAHTKTEFKMPGKFDVVGISFKNKETLLRLQQLVELTNLSPIFSDPFILNIAKQLVRFDQQNHTATPEFINTLFKSLELYLIHFLSIKQDEYHAEAGIERLVLYTLNKLSTAFDEKINIHDISVDLGVSHSYLSRIFKRKVGMTPHAFLLSKRLERAKTLLLETHLNIELIANEVGFNSQSHLTRYFTEFIGMPPSKYRRHMLRGN